MPAIKNILKHVRIEQAQRKRNCERSRAKHPIKKGDLCLVVQDDQHAPNYCLECANDILATAQTKLDELRNGMAADQRS